MPENGLIEGVFYEVSLVADGMAPGEAKAVASLKRVEDQAKKTGTAVDQAAGARGSAPPDDWRLQTFQRYESAFKSGSNSAQQFRNGVKSLGDEFIALAETSIAAGKGLATEAAAASGVAVAAGTAAVATEAAGIATKGLLATLGPLFVAMLGIEVISKLVRLAWDAMTRSSREAKAKVDELTESLLKNREAARPEDVKASERLQAAKDAAAAAQRRVDELSVPINRAGGGVGIFIAEAIRAGQLSAAQEDLAKKTKTLTEARRELTVATDSDASSTARRLALLVQEGVASEKNIADLKKLGQDARTELVLLAKAGAEGDAARQKLITDALGDPHAIEKRREQLAGIVKDANREAERLAAEAAKKAKEGERAGAKDERHDESVQALVDRLQTLKASLTSVADDNTAAQLKRINDEIKNVKPDPNQLALLNQLRDEIEGLANEKTAEKLGHQLRDLTAASTVSAVDDLTNALADQVKAFQDLGASQTDIDKLKAIQQPMIDATSRSEELAKAIEDIQRDLALGFNLKQDLDKIQPLIDAAIGARNKLHAAAPLDASGKPVATKAEALAQSDLDKLLAQEVELRERIRKLQLDAASKTESIRDKTQRLAGDVADAANAAYVLAAAFLGVDSNITKALGALGELGSGIDQLIESGGKSVTGWVQTIKGAFDLGKTLFGEDPAIAAARKETLAEMERLKMALLELKDAYLQNVSTDAVKKDIAAAEAALGKTVFGAQGTITFNGQIVLQPGEGGGPGRRGTLRDIGKTLGQDFDSGALLQYFKMLDAKYGTNLAGFVERQDPYGLLTAMRSIPDALKGELSRLGTFGNTAADVIKRVNFEFEALGKTNALDKFKATIKALKDAGIDLGEFGDSLAKLADPATTAEEAAKIVADIVARLTSGTGINFGGLTPEELKALLTQGADARRTDAGAAGTGGFNEVRTITEVTGSRIGAMLSTANIFAEMTANHTGIIAELMSRASGALGPVLPPSIGFAPGAPVFGSSGANSFSVSFSENSIQVNVSGATGDAEATGTKIGKAVITEISKGLANDLAWKNRAVGNLVRA